MTLPEALRHRWNFDIALSSTNADGVQCFRCDHCNCWVSADEMDRLETCPARERRNGQRRKFKDRRNKLSGSVIIDFT